LLRRFQKLNRFLLRRESAVVLLVMHLFVARKLEMPKPREYAPPRKCKQPSLIAYARGIN